MVNKKLKTQNNEKGHSLQHVHLLNTGSTVRCCVWYPFSDRWEHVHHHNLWNNDICGISASDNPVIQ